MSTLVTDVIRRQEKMMNSSRPSARPPVCERRRGEGEKKQKEKKKEAWEKPIGARERKKERVCCFYYRSRAVGAG